MQIIKLSGKASQIFKLFALLVKQQGNKTLEELKKDTEIARNTRDYWMHKADGAE